MNGLSSETLEQQWERHLKEDREASHRRWIEYQNKTPWDRSSKAQPVFFMLFAAASLIFIVAMTYITLRNMGAIQ